MRRSFWILMTYATRPMVWFIMAAMIGGGVFLYSASSRQYTDVDVGVLKSATPIRTAEQLESAIARPVRGGFEIDWGALAHEQLDVVLPHSGNDPRYVGAKEHEVVNQRLNALVLPKNVVAIHTRGWGVDQAVVDRLGEVTSLRRLGFLVSFGDDPLDLSPLSGLKHLQVLDLGISSRNTASLAPMLELPKLETLSIGSHQWVSKQRMAEIAKLPTLKTLYLPDISENETAMAALSELEDSSSLKQIRIAIPMDSPHRLASVQAVTPGFEVGSSKLYLPRLYAMIYAVWMTMVVGSLGLHLIAQLSLPIAQLAPKYQQAHQRGAWGIIAMLVAGSTILVCCYGANWLAVASVVGMCLVAGVGDLVRAQSSVGEFRGMQRSMRFVGALMLIALIGLAFLRPILAEEYLMGGSIALPLLFIAITAIVAYRTAKAMNQLCRSGIESGRPPMLSFHDVQRASIDLRNRKMSTTATAAESAAEPYARQGRLASNLGFLSVAVVVVSMLGPERLYGVGVRHYAVMACLILSFWSLFVIGVKWWQRIPYLAGMMVRPPRRDRQIDKLFRGVGVDVVQLWPVTIANLLLLSDTRLFSPDNVAIRLILSGLCVVSVTAVCYATMLWALTIRSIWGIAVMSCGVYFSLSFFVAGMISFGVTAAGMVALPSYRVVIATSAIAVLAIAAIIMARRYFQRMEWGRFV